MAGENDDFINIYANNVMNEMNEAEDAPEIKIRKFYCAGSAGMVSSARTSAQ